MTKQVKVLRENVIKSLSSIKDDNVSIADVAISRQRLLAALKLQTEDMITINYGKVSYHDATYHNTTIISEYDIDNEPCIQFSCNHTVFRFLNRPSNKHNYIEPKIIPLNFVDRTNIIKPELTGIPLDTEDLIRALSFVMPCVATDQARPVLNCILFESGDNIIKLVAADGYRLGIDKVVAEGIPTDKVLIDLADIKKLMVFLKSIKQGTGKRQSYPDVYLAHDYKTVKFSTVNNSIELEKQNSTQNYTFPDYTKLIPKDGTKIEFISNDMLEAVKALKHIANDGSGIIRLQFAKGINECSPGKILLTAKSEELGESNIDCDAIVEADCKIAVNNRYLIDLLRLCPNTKATIKVTDPSSPMVFDTDQDRQWVIMPMFVQW